jgi:hypothetical protein
MDLKYDFLRQTAGKAGLEPTDGLHVMIRKLTPFHFQMTRWALEQIREHAATEGTKMVILLVPSPAPAAVTAASFDDILPTVEGLGVPVIDLRDTFKDVKDLSNLYVEYPADVHPNQRGHEMIFETLYLKLQQDPSFSASLFGASRNQKESVAESR